MRVTPLDKTIPISYDRINTSLATPYFAAISDTYPNTSNHLKVHTNPFIDPFGSIGYPHYQDKQHTRATFLTYGGALSYSIPSASSVAMGVPIVNPPDLEEDYLYQVTGNLRSFSEVFPSEYTQISICLCHAISATNSGTPSEHYIATVISEYPFTAELFGTGPAIYRPNFSFNIPYSDLGAPRSDDSILMACIVIRNVESSPIFAPGLFINLNIWRMFAPLKVYNQWQA